MRRILLTMGLAFLLAFPVTATEIGGITMPDTLKAGEQNLILNGVGLRKKLWIKVYAGGLYLKEPTSSSINIIQADEPMVVRMHFIYDGVSAKKLIDAWNEGFDAALDGDTSSIQDKIDQFNGLFTEEAKEGDIYDIVYLPGVGTRVSFNGNKVGVVPGLAFKKALFAIWLGREPADDDLKDGMLGE